MSSKLELLFEKLNGKNWRQVNVLNLQFSGKISSNVFGTYKQIEQVISQINQPTQMVLSSYNIDIDKILKTLNDPKLPMSQSIKKLFINHLKNNHYPDYVKELIGGYINLKELYIISLENAKWLTNTSKLDKLSIIKIQQIETQQISSLGKKLAKIPNLQDLTVGLDCQANKTAATFLEDISYSKSLSKLCVKLVNYSVKPDLNQETQQIFIESGSFIAQMKNLTQIQFSSNKYFPYLPQFLGKMLACKQLNTFYLLLDNLTLENVYLCVKELSVCQANTIYFKPNFEDYNIELPLDLYDGFSHCSNLSSLYINLRIHYNKKYSSLQNRILKKCKRLVFVDFKYY